MDLYGSGEYRASKQWPYAVSSGCVVYRVNSGSTEILLLPRDSRKNNWGRNDGQVISYHLPKGHLDIGESLEDAAVRETQEEAGVRVALQTYLGKRDDVFHHPNTDIDTDKVVHYFAAEWREDLNSKDKEHDQPVWVSVDKAIELLGGPNPKHEDEIIRRLNKYLELMSGESS